MNRTIKTLVLQAVNTTGSYNPNDNSYLFADELTGEELADTENFLWYVNEHNLTFGRGNIDEVYKKYKDSNWQA
jgi:hypothetical protein